MQGSERSRTAARYRAHGALFVLLSCAPYRWIQRSTAWSPEYGRARPLKRVAPALKK